MKLQDKFLAGKDNHTYQRIDSDHSVNFFLGYNDSGNMSMVLIEFGKIEKVKSSKMIDVNLGKREDGRLVLSFDLLDNTFSSMFMVFCKDMIVVCEKAGRDLAISNALIRWKYWKELFGRKRSQLLDKSEIKGLIGELIELRDYFVPLLGVKNSIQAWMGPLLGHKDFEALGTWHEIKTINDGAIQIIVSSLEQLDSEYDGHLHVVKLEETSPVSSISFNLNQLVLQITNLILDPEDLDAFRTKLDNVGYEPNEAYDNFSFTYKGTQRYHVNSEFPRLTRRDVKKSIGNVKYTILLDGISEFQEE